MLNLNLFSIHLLAFFTCWFIWIYSFLSSTFHLTGWLPATICCSKSCPLLFSIKALRWSQTAGKWRGPFVWKRVIHRFHSITKWWVFKPAAMLLCQKGEIVDFPQSLFILLQLTAESFYQKHKNQHGPEKYRGPSTIWDAWMAFFLLLLGKDSLEWRGIGVLAKNWPWIWTRWIAEICNFSVGKVCLLLVMGPPIHSRLR